MEVGDVVCNCRCEDVDIREKGILFYVGWECIFYIFF